MSYKLTARADADLKEIQRFIILEMENPEGARIVADYLADAFERIGRDPSHCGGRPRPEITSLPYKFLTVRKYVVVYDDRSSPVNIMFILGASRDLPAVLASDPREDDE